jgi:hypothetical protein
MTIAVRPQVQPASDARKGAKESAASACQIIVVHLHDVTIAFRLKRVNRAGDVVIVVGNACRRAPFHFGQPSFDDWRQVSK